MADRLENTCPKCGAHLMLREGQFGDFLACPKFPACRYTEPLRESAWAKDGTLLLEQRQPKNPYCKECNHTGLIPFINKQGKLIVGAFLDCECRIEIQAQGYNNYRDIRPDDFDYPMSDTFREFTYEHYGRPWEQRSAFIKQEAPTVAVSSASKPWDKRQQYQLDQTRGELIHIRDKLAEMTAKKKPMQLPKKSTYTGLVIK